MYAIRYDWAAESDRVAWSVGVKSEDHHMLQDFLDTMDAPDADPVSAQADNITDLKEWMAHINRFHAGQRG